MNAITEIQDLLRIPGQHQTPYFAIYRDKICDQNRLADNYRNADNTIENCERELREYLNMFSKSGCNFEIWFSEIPKPSKGGFRIPFYMNSCSQGNAIGAIPMQPAVDIQIEIAKAIDNYKRDTLIETQAQRIIQLERELAEERKEKKETGTDRFLSRLEPLVQPIAGLLANQMAPGSGIGNIFTNQNTQEPMPIQAIDPTEIEKVAYEALQSLINSNPNDAHIILHNISEWAKKEKDLNLILNKLVNLDPVKYNMAKTML